MFSNCFILFKNSQTVICETTLPPQLQHFSEGPFEKAKRTHAAAAFSPANALDDDMVKLARKGPALQFAFWRVSSLLIALFALTVPIIIVAVRLPSRRDSYDKIAEMFPKDIRPYTTALIASIFYADVAMEMSEVLAVLCVVVGTWKWQTIQPSRKWVWLGLGFMLVPPFILLLLMPFRQQVDYEQIARELCKFNVREQQQNNMGAFGLTIDLCKQQPNQGGVDPLFFLDKDIEGYYGARYCEQYAFQWTNHFFGKGGEKGDAGKIQQVWDDCVNMPTMSCLPFPGSEQAKACGLYCGILANINPQFTAFAQSASSASFTALRKGSEVANIALQSSEYVLGTLLGVFAMKLLLPLALSFSNGFAGAVLNVKCIFPMNPLMGFMLMAAVALSLPMYAALLATMYQVVGAYLLVPALLSLLLSMALFCLCSPKFARHGTLEHFLQLINRIRWAQLFLLLVTGTFVVLFVLKSQFKEFVQYIPDIDILFAVRVVFEVFGKTILFNVAGTDMIIRFLLLLTERQAELTPAELIYERQTLHQFSVLIADGSKEAVVVPRKSRTNNQQQLLEEKRRSTKNLEPAQEIFLGNPVHLAYTKMPDRQNNNNARQQPQLDNNYRKDRPDYNNYNNNNSGRR